MHSPSVARVSRPVSPASQFPIAILPLRTGHMGLETQATLLGPSHRTAASLPETKRIKRFDSA